ncbi:MAG TPA: rhomboid family intramembrane serine protease [Pyrinomonadaceae bacterium]|nr:rhomboid family intramembrane serine protease [Pyrinomonadaceae bacterium]
MSDSEAEQVRKDSRPGLCRNCGAIVGAGESECAVCGTPLGWPAGRTPPSPPDREAIRFARAVLSRPHKFTIIFLAANLFVFLMMWQSSGTQSGALWEFPTEVLIAYGAKLNILIKGQGQWWRFITPMFLHAGLIHLLVNMYALWMLGPYVEKLYGSAKFVVFWVVTGIAGVVASYLSVVEPGRTISPVFRFIFKYQDAPSVGASGALFGLVGVLFVFGIKFRHELPEGFKRAFGTGLLPMILLNLFIGYMGRGIIDNAAHLGGLLSGAAIAVAVHYRRPGSRGGVALIWRILQISALSVIAFSFYRVIQHFRDALPDYAMAARVQQLERPPTPSFIRYFKAFHESQEALLLTINDRDSGGIDAALEQLDSLPPLDEKANTLRNTLKPILRKAKELNTRVVASPRPLPVDLERERATLVRELSLWTTNYNEWLKTEGKKYGVAVSEEQNATN